MAAFTHLVFVAVRAHALPHESILAPRANGMGGAYTAIADDPNGALWNPAGPAQIETLSVGTSFAQIFEDIRMFGFSFLLPTFKKGNYGALLNTIDYGSIERRDDFGAPLGSVSRQDYTLTGSASRLFLKQYGLGANLNYSLATMQGQGSISAASLDLGALYLGPHGLSGGFSILNLGGRLTGGEQFRTGLGWKAGPANRQLLFAMDVERSDLGTSFMAGGECDFRFIAFRGGFAKHPKTLIPTAGFGVSLSNLKVDYAASLADFGPRHVFSFSYAFKTAVPELSRKQDEHEKALAKNAALKKKLERLLEQDPAKLSIRFWPYEQTALPEFLATTTDVWMELFKVQLAHTGAFNVLEGIATIEQLEKAEAERQGPEYEDDQQPRPSGRIAPAQLMLKINFERISLSLNQVNLEIIRADTKVVAYSGDVAAEPSSADFLLSLENAAYGIACHIKSGELETE